MAIATKANFQKANPMASEIISRQVAVVIKVNSKMVLLQGKEHSPSKMAIAVPELPQILNSVELVLANTKMATVIKVIWLTISQTVKVQ
jgi:hypothetical protein